MPIDPKFQANMVATTFENLKVRKNSESNLGIYDTDVAVDFFDLCISDGDCIAVSPVNVFDWQDANAGRKALPSRERDCIYYFECEAVCPKLAIRVSKP
ncbi:MAG TPA: ferredoxin family protein [Nitrososphaera sp.]|nr:ferredoxin family protein [Nitrososphaera sp.]